MAGKYRFIKGPISIDELNNKKKSKRYQRIQQTVDKIEKQWDASFENVAISDDIEENIKIFEGIFKDCSDFILRRFILGNGRTKCFAAYIDNLVKREMVSNNILKPLMTDVRLTGTDAPVNTSDLIGLVSDASVYSGDIKKTGLIGDAVKKILAGHCAVFTDGCRTSLLINIIGVKGREVSEPRIEAVVRGPHEAFIENYKSNLSLLRKRIKTPDFKIEKLQIGKLSSTSVLITYIKGIAVKRTEALVKKEEFKGALAFKLDLF